MTNDYSTQGIPELLRFQLQSLETSISLLDVSDAGVIQNDLGTLLNLLKAPRPDTASSLLILDAIKSTVESRPEIVDLYLDLGILQYIKPFMCLLDQAVLVVVFNLLIELVKAISTYSINTESFFDPSFTNDLLKHFQSPDKMISSKAILVLLHLVSKADKFQIQPFKENKTMLKSLESLLISISERTALTTKDLSKAAQILSILAILTKDNEAFCEHLLNYGLLNSVFFLLSLESHIVIEYTLGLLGNIALGGIMLKAQLAEFGILENIEHLIEKYSCSSKQVALHITTSCVRVLVNLTAFDASQVNPDRRQYAKEINDLVLKSGIILKTQLLLVIGVYDITILTFKLLSNLLTFDEDTDYAQKFFDYDLLLLMKKSYITLARETDGVSGYVVAQYEDNERIEICFQLLTILRIVTQSEDQSRIKEVAVGNNYLSLLVTLLDDFLEMNPQLAELALEVLSNLSSIRNREVQQEFNLYKDNLRGIFKRIAMSTMHTASPVSNLEELATEVSINVEI